MIGSVLVVQTGFLGDAILATSLTAALAMTPEVDRVGLVVRQSYAGLFVDHPDIDHLYPIVKRERTSRREVVEGIRRERFDVALLPHRSLSSSLLVRQSSVPRRVGFRSAEGALLYTDRVDYRIGVPEVLRNLDLRAAILSGPVESISPPATRIVPNRHGFEEYSVGPSVAVAYGSVWPTKQWGRGRYAELCRRLKRSGIRPLLIGSPEERAEGERIALDAGVPQSDLLAGRLSLRELATLLSRVTVTLSNDSGAMHLSEAVGTPVIAIFGPTVRAFGFAPLLDASSLIDAGERPCRPCGIHGGMECPLGHHRCMSEIGVDEVLEQVQKRIGGRGA